MKVAFEFTNLLGSSYRSGNVLFTRDGNSVLSPVGNRISLFDLVNHKCSTFPFENQTNIARLALSPDGTLLVSVDESGRALLVNFHKRVVINRFNFKAAVDDVQFSGDSRFLAVTNGKRVQVWRAPDLVVQFAPFTLHRTYTGHHDDVLHVNWSPDSRFLFTSSRDMTVRMFSLHPIDGFVPLTLAGHKSAVLASFVDDASNLYTVAKDGTLIVWSYQENASDGNGAAGMFANGRFRLDQKHFFMKDHAKVESVAFHRSPALNLLVAGFDSGVFSLYDLPSFQEIHSLSVSQEKISSVAINASGEWLAFGSSSLGQLLVWEYQSETYVLKQQGHFHDVSTMAYSPDGQLVATGGDDGKVKIWNSASGFCFATFVDHAGPVTDLAFTSAGNVVLSASLDGTVRAYDLVRYRNFRTMVAPTTCQFLSLAIDPSGEIVCAGAMDPFEIYVWSLQTGRLLDVLAGHDGPVSSLAFSPEQSMLASASWDRTVRVWDVFERKTAIDTMQHSSDVLAVAFRPDGNELCSSALDGQLYFWDVNQSTLRGTIECAKDVRGGRRRDDARTAANSTHGTSFTSIAYSPDGICVLAGGNSKYVCLYEVFLITGRGMPGYLTRRFVRVVQDRLSIPAYGIVDYNPHGASIMLTYKLGSLAAGHESEIYAANILYTGLFWSDIATLKIAETSLKSMTALDFKVANNLLLDPFVIDNPAYAKVITDMIENKVKAELEALNQVEFDFVLKYIQHKILAQQAI